MSESDHAPRARRAVVLARLLTASASVALVAACAQAPKQTAGGGRSKEYFSTAKYGPASPRVVQDGQAVPKGGGKYLVGRPYTIAGKTYYPAEKSSGYSATGMASWYGGAFHGRRTANGEIYDMSSITAAHPTMPLPSYVRVTNTANNRSIIVRVNDRGPYHGGRIMDMSQRVAELLQFKHLGTARVKIDYLGKAGLDGSDDRKLVATLRTDGPAQLDGYSAPSATMVAEAEPVAPAPRAPRPEPAPLPVVATPALAAPRPQPVAQTTTVAAATTTPIAGAAGYAPLPQTAPLPPARPFDLATIPGAGSLISAGPSRPAARQAAATYFAPDATLAARFERSGPFVGLSAGRFEATSGGK